MFVTLPLFLSIGFLIGYGLKKESQYAWRGTYCNDASVFTQGTPP